MKHFIIALSLALAVPAWAVDSKAADVAKADAAKAQKAETVKVCVDQMKDGKPVKDAKGNVKQTCKEVKKHKKHEGTKVEGTKPDKK